MDAQVRELLDHMLNEKRPARERCEAGNRLARLGDPRPEVMTVEGMGLIHIPAGPFHMGSAEDDPFAYSDECPQFTANLASGYWISQYPVTQAQFAQFVEAGGYQTERYWQEATINNFWSMGGYKGIEDDAPRQGPFAFGEPFDLPNHPVVGVSWYEAIAFCRWLGELLSHQNTQLGHGLAGGKLEITLPSEAEWQKAARGTQGRRYPWGDDLDTNRANLEEMGIGATSAIGCFTGGASPYGVQELSGNVWEWTRSILHAFPYAEDIEARGDFRNPNQGRAMCGGGWENDGWFARCAVRNASNPGVRNNNIGFRVAVISTT